MELESWGKLYQELAEKINTEIPAINWVDLWHNQVGFLVEEHPFPTPALFLAFRILSVEDTGEKVQKAIVQIDMFYFYQTFLDTYNGAYNQNDALDYLDNLTALHKIFHASSGENYSEMRRTGLAAVDTGSAGNLYRQSFNCLVIDASAQKEFEQVIPGELDLTKSQITDNPSEPYFLIP